MDRQAFVLGRSSVRPSRLVFVDFDGVLHPAGGEPGQALPFCWVPYLSDELAAHPDVALVVHSSWGERFALDELREFLSPLGERVIAWVGNGPKAQAIQAFMRAQPQVRHWLVIDDDAAQFGEEFAGSLLICDPRTGISNSDTQGCLRAWLWATRPDLVQPGGGNDHRTRS
jgi:hypothetical protein